MGKPTFLIIDGSSMLASAYHASIPYEMKACKTEDEREQYYDKIMHSPDGQYANAVTTMLRGMKKLLEETKPDHLAVAFDKSRESTFPAHLWVYLQRCQS